ncbi:prepilin-type N-terminal cleavage/methylation domain-containing protein [Pseudophaeobacter sp.]|uniref:prepilin-type N-terminal cleavage/methylation domain-containing protein n=1 Tax=Pseudophaeobacter sp. TaxID=1971739 RepID=UPI0032995A16
MDPELEPDATENSDGLTADLTVDLTAGFTLIELLVCIAILAVVTFGASLALPRGGTAQDRDMALFQRQFKTLRQQAITSQTTQGLVISPRGFNPARPVPRPLTEDPPGAGTALGWRISPQQQRWQGRVSFAVTAGQIGGEATGAASPEIQFLADGRTTAFRLRFTSGDTARQASCHSDGWTGLKCKNS